MNYKILHLVNSDQRRGAEVFATQLAHTLSYESQENAICIIKPAADGGLPTNGLKRYDLPLAKGPRVLNPVFDWSKVAALRRAMLDFRPDVLISHGSSALKYGAISRLFYKDSLNVYRNIGMASFWARSKARSRFNRFLLDRFDLYISLSGITKRDFTDEYGVADESVVTIPNGVYSGPFVDALKPETRRESRYQLGLSDQDFAIVNVGSLSPEKGQHQLLDMIRDIRPQFPSVKLLIVGDGPLGKSLVDKAKRLGIDDSVAFLGARDDVSSILGASDLFVLPSGTESMPGALIEAGFAGLSSVAYDVGAISDILDNGINGLMVEAGDYEAFKKAVVRLMVEKETRERMSRAIHEKCKERFDIQRVAAQYIEAIDRLFAERYPAAYPKRELS